MNQKIISKPKITAQIVKDYTNTEILQHETWLASCIMTSTLMQQ